MFKSILIAGCLCLVLTSVKTAAGQVRVGVNGEIPLSTLDEMKSLLSLADAHQKADLLVRLGVDSAIAHPIAEGLLPGEEIELQPLRTQGEAHYGFTFLPNGTGVSCFLYLLQGSDESTEKKPWHVVDQQSIDCWGGAATVETMTLRHFDLDDIVLHQVTENHGSGVLAKETQVFSILNGRLQLTLSTRDYLSEVVWGTEDEELERRSTFLRFPNNALEESRTSANKDKLKKVERRYWRWSEQKHLFVASQFMPVSVPALH